MRVAADAPVAACEGVSETDGGVGDGLAGLSSGDSLIVAGGAA